MPKTCSTDYRQKSMSIKKLHSTCCRENKDGYSVKQPYSTNNGTLQEFGFALREETPDISCMNKTEFMYFISLVRKCGQDDE
jgi:hypothetical protein